MLVTTPMQTIILLSLVQYSHESWAVANAVLAPGLIGLWIASLGLAAELITEDRRAGRFQLLVLAPAPLSLAVFGRVVAVMLFGVFAFAEAWLVAALGFDVVLSVANVPLVAAAIGVTCLAMAGTATLLSAVFVLARGLEVFQNSMNYPFYILGGVMVPLAMLPAWLHPIGSVFFLSWSADLLRAEVLGTSTHWLLSLCVISGLGLAALLSGLRLIRLLVDRGRRDGGIDAA